MGDPEETAVGALVRSNGTVVGKLLGDFVVVEVPVGNKLSAIEGSDGLAVGSAEDDKYFIVIEPLPEVDAVVTVYSEHPE